jgi:hypothetical protein
MGGGRKNKPPGLLAGDLEKAMDYYLFGDRGRPGYHRLLALFTQYLPG